MTSKLPQVGTSIFAVMTQMANEHGAINLAQGFPDFEIDPVLIDSITKHMQAGANQYAPMPGVPALRTAIAEKIAKTYHISTDANEVTITSGATQALFASIMALVKLGDEVIYFDPAYDSYMPTIVLSGGVPVSINLNAADFSIPWDQVADKITDKTKMIIVNSPHNPSGAIWSREDMDELARLTRDKDIVVLSDEVYEHLIYDGHSHQSVLMHAELREKSIAVYSFGKTFHATGWKMGYTVARPQLTEEIRKVHQFMVFSVNPAVQLAIADYLTNPSHYEGLPVFFQKKRDALLSFMAPSRFQPLPCLGTYFQAFSYAEISDRSELDMAEWITKNHGVATIPFSPFYTDGSDHRYLRICFAKSEKTLQLAAEKLCQI